MENLQKDDIHDLYNLLQSSKKEMFLKNIQPGSSVPSTQSQ